MATSSIFTNFAIKDKKTASAFVKALEEASAGRRPDTEIGHTLLSDPAAIKERFSKLANLGKR